MLQDLALALRLQALDRKIANLDQEIATLPKHIAEIERKLGAHTRALDANRAALLANARERKKLEGEIEVHSQKITKLRDQMLQAKTNEQYRAFQNEISYAESETRKAEDKTLSFMEQSEPLEKNVKSAEIELKKQHAHVESEKALARDKTAVDLKARNEALAVRKSITDGMDKKFYTEYERIRKKTKGTVIADASDGLCDACHISLRPQFFQDLRKGDNVMFCESCSRILTYNPVIDAEGDLSASQRIA